MKLQQGKSLSILINLPETYALNRFVDLEVFLGNSLSYSYSYGDISKIGDRNYKLALPPKVTGKLQGDLSIQIKLKDSELGEWPFPVETLTFFRSLERSNGSSLNTGADIVFNLLVSDTGLEVDLTLSPIFRGYSAYEIALQNNAFVGTEAEFAEYQTGKNTRNFTNVTVPDGELFLHNMGSTRLSVAFYDLNGVEDEFITWQPYDSQYIRVHGGHSGDIYITKRNASTISLEGVEDGDLIEHTVASTKVYTEVYDENGILDRAVKIIPVDASHVRINLPGIELINDVLNRSYTGELYIVAR